MHINTHFPPLLPTTYYQTSISVIRTLLYKSEYAFDMILISIILYTSSTFRDSLITTPRSRGAEKLRPRVGESQQPGLVSVPQGLYGPHAPHEPLSLFSRHKNRDPDSSAP